MSLTSIQVKNAKPKDKPYKLHDADGLFLVIRPTGKKVWRIDYRIFGKEKSTSIGRYPALSLKEARSKRNETMQEVEKGEDPSVKKQLVRMQGELAHSSILKLVAEDWIERRGGKWSRNYRKDVWNRLSNHVFPYLGNKPMQLITPQELLLIIRKVESKGKIDMAKRCLSMVSQIFRYGVAIGIVERDITYDLKGAIATRKVKHNPTLREEDIPEFLIKLENYNGDRLTKLAMEMLLLTMVRTIELRGATWHEINFKKQEWRIPAERMKMDKEHIVPLSARVIEILNQIKSAELSEEFIFPNQNNPFDIMSTNTILYALYRMGYHKRLTAHGFRGTASTILNEHGFNSDWIERQLAHSESNSVRAAYNHAQYLPERRKMLDWWSIFLAEKGLNTK